MLSGAGRALDQRVEDGVAHVLFRLGMSLARAHGTVKVALGGGFDDVLHRQCGHTFAAQQIGPQELGAIYKAHVLLYHLIMKIAVTGASGFIGTRLMEKLGREGRAVSLRGSLEGLAGADAV